MMKIFLACAEFLCAMSVSEPLFKKFKLKLECGNGQADVRGCDKQVVFLLSDLQ